MNRDHTPRNRSSRRWRTRLAAPLILAAVSACTPPATTAPPPTTSSPSTAAPSKPAPPADQHLRNVTRAMIYSDGIAHVLDETAAQMICGALTPTEWHQILGADVGRLVYGGVGAKCVISTGALVVDLERTVETLGTAGELIAGRRVEVDGSLSSRQVAAASAALVPLGEQDVPAQQRVGARPVLHVLARTATGIDQDPADLPAQLRRLLAALLPKLTPTGPATPVYDDAGKLAYTPTEPVPGVPIYDLPQTVQALLLCTVVLRDAGIQPRPTDVFVNSVAECSVDRLRIFAKVDQFIDPAPETSPYKVAGRPAEERADIGVVINLLTMPARYDRTEHLTLRLTNHAPPARLRAWAERVAARLLTT